MADSEKKPRTLAAATPGAVAASAGAVATTGGTAEEPAPLAPAIGSTDSSLVAAHPSAAAAATTPGAVRSSRRDDQRISRKTARKESSTSDSGAREEAPAVVVPGARHSAIRRRNTKQAKGGSSTATTTSRRPITTVPETDDETKGDEDPVSKAAPGAIGRPAEPTEAGEISVTAMAVTRDDLEEEVRQQILSNVVVAQAVSVVPEDDDGDAKKESVRGADPEGKTEDGGRNSRSRLLWIVVVGLLLVAAGVVVGVVLGSGGGSDDSEKDPSDADGEVPDQGTRLDRPETIRLETFLSVVSPDLLVEGTPQNQALEWMISNGIALDNDATGTTRDTFVLATLYYATNGANWTRNEGWLDPTWSFCDWYPGSICTNPPNTGGGGNGGGGGDGGGGGNGGNNGGGGNGGGGRNNGGGGGNGNGGGGGGGNGGNNGGGGNGGGGGNNGGGGNGNGNRNNQRNPRLRRLQGGGSQGGDVRVNSLVLKDNNLVGSLPQEVLELRVLKELDVTDNPGLTGTLSDLGEVDRLDRLQFFRAGNTGFTGTFPSGLRGLSDIREFEMPGAIGMTGALPYELWVAPRIRILNLEGLGLTGLLPRRMGNSPREVYLKDNALFGDIPVTEKVDWRSLRVLDLRNNDLTGTIPAALANNFADRLVDLRLEGNNLEGTVPEAVCASVPLDAVFSSDCAAGTNLTCSCCTSCCTAGEDCAASNTN